jgi:inosine/xanthosine triphosphate pyrophosphatase family protein
MEPLLLATTNTAKLDRLRALIAGLPVFGRTPADIGCKPPVIIPEDGASFLENAKSKAIAWSEASGGLLSIASDGGLQIPALGRAWDELRTRRNACDNARPVEQIDHLLKLMRGLPGLDREAHWHEALAIARGGTILASWTASREAGLVVDAYVPAPTDSEFWTESIRLERTTGKLYRDLGADEQLRLDTVWNQLRDNVREYFSVSRFVSE